MSLINVDTIESRVGGPPTLSKGVLVSAAATFSGDLTRFDGAVSVGGTLTYEDVTNVDAIGIVTARGGMQFGAAGVGGTVTSVGNATFAGIVTASSFVGAVTGTTGSYSGNLTVGSGVTIGPAGVATFSGTADVHLYDGVQLNVGDASDLEIYHNGTDSYIKGGSSGELVIRHDAITMQAASSTDTYFDAVYDGEVSLRYNNSKKFETTNDGVKITGIATCSNGIDAVGMLREGYNTVANKISAAPNIDIAQGNIHYFTTTETTTATPNIRYDSSYSLNNKMSAGDVLSLTIITTAAAAGYADSWQIDGSGITEEWVGGSAPTAGGSDGYDIYTLTILKTADASWKVFINVSNAT